MAHPDRTVGQPAITLPPDLNPPSEGRIAAVTRGLDRVYQSDEFAEAVRIQASGEAEIIYDTANPDDSSRRPVFTDGQVVLTRYGVAYGFLSGEERGIEVSPPGDARGKRRITTSVWISGSGQVGGTLIRPSQPWEQRDLTTVELTPDLALGALQRFLNTFSEPQTNA